MLKHHVVSRYFEGFIIFVFGQILKTLRLLYEQAEMTRITFKESLRCLDGVVRRSQKTSHIDRLLPLR